jgi:membrane protease YdiL (CAAX protease family)
MNALFGQSLRVTVTQMAAAFVAGTAFYITLMTTGTLLVAMLLHALWDFGTLGLLATDRQQRPIAGFTALGMFLISLGTVGFVIAAA